MNIREEREKITKSAQKALKELNKLILQEIDLDSLEPEKAKAAAQGKIEAIEGSFRIVNLINEQLIALGEVEEEKKEKRVFKGPEKMV